jgi:hypothetical protein
MHYNVSVDDRHLAFNVEDASYITIPKAAVSHKFKVQLKIFTHL